MLILVGSAVALLAAVMLTRVSGTEYFPVLASRAAIMAIVTIALTAIPAYILARRLTRPIRQIAEGARRLADEDFSQTIDVQASNELAALARSLNLMSRRLSASFAQLERDREQLRVILSGMVEGVVAFDNQQELLFVNDRAAELLSFPVATIPGRKLWEVIRNRALTDVVERALAGSEPQRQELDWPGPTVKSLEVYASRLPGPLSPGAVLVLHDTTELRRLERLRQDFVANVSHELKTPLANIKSSVEVLQDGAADDPQARDGFLSEIDEAADRLNALIMDLLTLARVEGAENRLHLESVHVEEAVYACLDRHRTRAEGQGLSLSAVALGNCPPTLSVLVDEEGLAQILDNLVDNAIKYTPTGGRIVVRWQAIPPGQVTLEVQDTGIGIPASDLPRVFERFYRVDRARSRKMGGTGLGLAIVKHLAQSMGGSIRVTSALNRGTTFHVTLPRPEESLDHRTPNKHEPDR
jgi:two-component system phosphate regulon sensor histidine kinase PhoR